MKKQDFNQGNNWDPVHNYCSQDEIVEDDGAGDRSGFRGVFLEHA